MEGAGRGVVGRWRGKGREKLEVCRVGEGKEESGGEWRERREGRAERDRGGEGKGMERERIALL